jgi:DNA-binding SARP family transcriptional activator
VLRDGSLQLEAFNGFPYGLLVLDRRGRLICCNREATRVIGSMGLAQDGLTCCTLLGCHTPHTALESECLTELVLEHEATVPEIRLDVRSATGVSSMWVTAGAVGRKGDQVVVQLRPGIAGDRRKCTSKHWVAGGRLRIRVLGSTVVESPAGQIGGAWLDQRTGQLLKYLVAERRRAVTVDEIGESIWPGSDYAVGASVRYYVHALRRKLEPERGPREPSVCISACGGSYRVDLSHVSVDADEFEEHVSAGLASSGGDGAEEIERGLAFYRGDFLAELPYAEWALPERHRLHDLACAGLGRLADVHVERRALDGAIGALERLVALQPFDEDVHRRLMELDIELGRRSDAVRRYTALRCRLRKTFGQDPEFTPADLARARV